MKFNELIDRRIFNIPAQYDIQILKKNFVCIFSNFKYLFFEYFCKPLYEHLTFNPRFKKRTFSDIFERDRV